MSLNSAALRTAWKAYEAAPQKMVKVPIGIDTVIVAKESEEAWSALDAVLTAHGYDVRKADTASYADRNIAGTKLKSLHAYGIAVDINWSTNPVKSNPKSPMRFSDKPTQAGRAADVKAGRADTDMTKAMVDDILSIRTNDGMRVFEWGNWKNKIDPMHFELDLGPSDLTNGINWATVRTEPVVPTDGGGEVALPDDAQKAPAGVSAQFEAAHAVIAKWEGGFVNHPSDPGGATNFGITINVLAAWRGQPVTVADVKALTYEEAERIFHARYWQPMRLDQMPYPAALMAYNCGVNSGPARGARFLQAALNRQGNTLAVDGKIGPMTIAAANAADQARLVADFSAAYEAYYRSLSTWPVFGKGWMNRLRDVTGKAAQAAGQPVITPMMAEDPVLVAMADVQAQPSVPPSVTIAAPTLPKENASMTTIDKVLGGETLTGKKTLLAGIGLPLVYALDQFNMLNMSDPAMNSILAALAAFGGLGALSKIERAAKG